MTDVIPVAPEPGASGAAIAIGDVEIECPIKVKTEIEQSRDCLICSCHTNDQWYDLFWTETRSGHSPLVAYVCRVAEVKLTEAPEAGGRFVCRTCVELINVLERAELEYYRLKESFVAIISENPAFERTSLSGLTRQLEVELVKHEVEDVVAASRTRARGGVRARGKNSDDEPLVLRKKRAKKPTKRRKDMKDHVDIAEELTSLYTVKEEDEERTLRQSHRYPSIDLAGEDEVSVDGADWTIDSQEPDDDYDPTINKSKSKRKQRSLENNLRKRSGLRSKLQNVSIPVLGAVPPNMVIKKDEDSKLDNLVETENIVEKLQKLQKKTQPKAVFPCSECTAKLSSLSRLSFHMAKHEAAKAPFICEICGANYKHKKACDIHVALHKGISDWKCEECNKLFPSKGALQRHNGIHTGKPNYQCDLCGKSFIHTSSFKMHKLSHTGVKPHACDVCGLALMTRSHLKRHKRIHSGEKRHECTVCGKRFSERYNLLAHQKSHEQPPPGQPTTAAPRKPWQGFRCHLCDKRFERRYMLEKHLEQVHQRILEKGPPRPRNTMTKLLKAQAAAVSKTVARLDGNDQLTQQQGSAANAAIQSEPGASSAEDTSVDVKPHITHSLEDKETDSGAGKSSPQPTAPPVSRPTVATGEAYETLRLTNGAWASGSYVASEYSMRIAEYPQ